LLYVIDSSVALKWFFDEPLKAQARAFAQTLGRVLTADGGIVANFGPRGLAVPLAEFVS
jgi:hypothetical protein